MSWDGESVKKRTLAKGTLIFGGKILELMETHFNNLNATKK
jgi:hypothetical protein